MEKILFILLLIIFDDSKFYNNIKEVNPSNYTYIVNKNNKLSKNYVPSDLELINIKYSCENKYLRRKAKIAFEKMANDAKKENMNIIVVSAYRSFDYQEKLYTSYVDKLGIFRANIASSKAGHSEHQTGLAIDVSDETLNYDNFENTKEFIWMINNSYKYGFILRYPKAKYHITGFKYEPWHFRYVGIRLATYIFFNDVTLEETISK